MGFVERFAIRLTPQEQAKLEELAHQTRRTKAAVIRSLLAQARVEDRPDIRLEASRT